MARVPPYPNATEVINLMRLTGPSEEAKYRKGIRWLRGIGCLGKRGKRIVVVTSKLNRALPDVYDMLCDMYT